MDSILPAICLQRKHWLKQCAILISFQARHCLNTILSHQCTQTLSQIGQTYFSYLQYFSTDIKEYVIYNIATIRLDVTQVASLLRLYLNEGKLRTVLGVCYELNNTSLKQTFDRRYGKFFYVMLKRAQSRIIIVLHCFIDIAKQ